MVKPLSLRTQWVLVLTFYSLALPAIAGFAAYRIIYRSIEDDAVSVLTDRITVARTAIENQIKNKRERVAGVLRLVNSSCNVSGALNPWCASDELKVLQRERATGIRLNYAKKSKLNLGSPRDIDCPPYDLCFGTDSKGRLVYRIGATDAESGMTLVTDFDLRELEQARPSQTAPTSVVLANVGGSPVVLGVSEWSPEAVKANWAECERMTSGSTDAVGRDGRYVAYGRVGSVPNTCIVSSLPKAGVLRPLSRLQSNLLRVGLVFAVLSFPLAWLLSSATTRGLRALRESIKRFRKGESLPPARKSGPAEVRELASTFHEMAESLQQSRAALAESERRLTMAYRAAQLIIWEHHLDTGRILWRDPAEPRGTEKKTSVLGFLRRVHPGDRHNVVTAIRQALETGEYSVEHRVRRNGDWIWVSSRGQVVRKLLVGVTADITHSREAERLRADRERLLATAEMSGVLAHEINNPLASITGALYMARQRKIDDPELEKFLRIGSSEAQRVVDIVRSLLQLHTQPASTLVDVSELWKAVIAASSPIVKAKEQRVDFKGPTPLPVHGYVDDLRHAFSNLLRNALESSPQGGRIQVRLRRGREVNSGAKGVWVLVCDNGVGIPVERLSSIFDPFVSTKSQKGKGLGLWVTRAAVMRHGGRIRIRSVNGKRSGTVVRLFIPARAASATA